MDVSLASRIDLAALLLEMQRPQEAIDTLQTAISALAADSGSDTVDLTEVHYRLSIAYLMLRQNDNAIGELEIVLRRQPRHAGAHMYLGQLYFQQGQFDRAWQHVRQAEAFGAPVAELIEALSRASEEP